MANPTICAHARAQMRFPTALVKADAAGGWMLAAHHMTLLDGEMLVDEDLATGSQTRRFLAYDCIALGGHSLTHKPWKARTHHGFACLWTSQPQLAACQFSKYKLFINLYR